MSISKINSASFKGYLTIIDKDSIHKFSTGNIAHVSKDKEENGVSIYGVENDLVPYRRLFIPNNVIPSNTVIAAYNAALQSPSTEFVVKSKSGNCKIFNNLTR